MLVVVEDDRPIAVPTDLGVALHGKSDSRLAEAMSAPPVTIRADGSVSEATARMATRGVRRLAVVDTETRLFDVLSADDVLRVVASEVAGLAAVAAAQLPPEPEPEHAAPPAARPAAAHYGREVATVRADAPVSAAVAQMKEKATAASSSPVSPESPWASSRIATWRSAW